MNSHAYKTFIGEAPDPRQTVYDTYKEICLGLQNFKKSEETEALYRKENPNRHDYGWRNTVKFDFDDITDITAKDGAFRIELGYNKPCGRGCCSDWVSDQMTIPDTLIAAHEASEAWLYSEDGTQEGEPNAHYQALLAAFVESIVLELDERIAAEKAEALRKKEAAKAAAEARKIKQAREKEERDRLEYARLKEKFA
jgi:hypothetical protein